jgi:CheY-like chemotaxis protein
VRVVVPFPAGSSTDIITRVLTNSVSQAIGQQLVVDNKAGADITSRSQVAECFSPGFQGRSPWLCLAMVYGVTQRHGAEIEMESTLGKGTTVRVSFPQLVSGGGGLTQLAIAAASPTRQRVLVVDDDPLLIKSLRDTLESDGHTVVVANGGREGIEVFKTSEERDERFDVVITDLGTPYVDGRAVASALKTARPSVPVILLTGWGQRLVAEGEIPPYVDRVLGKPPRLRELRTALAEVVTLQVPTEGGEGRPGCAETLVCSRF